MSRLGHFFASTFNGKNLFIPIYLLLTFIHFFLHMRDLRMTFIKNPRIEKVIFKTKIVRLILSRLQGRYYTILWQLVFQIWQSKQNTFSLELDPWEMRQECISECAKLKITSIPTPTLLSVFLRNVNIISVWLT